MREQLATIAEVHHEIQFGVCLESIVQFYNEGRLNALKDVPLSLSFNQQVALAQHCFLEHLQGVDLASVALELDHVDLAEGATSHHFLEKEVLLGNLLAGVEHVLCELHLFAIFIHGLLLDARDGPWGHGAVGFVEDLG